jgi:hypothetical protein
MREQGIKGMKSRGKRQKANCRQAEADISNIKSSISNIKSRKDEGEKLGYFDCSSGIAGNMVLGALLDAGLDRKEWQAQLSRLRLPVTVRVAQVKRQGVSATHVRIALPTSASRRVAPRNRLPEIARIIRRARLGRVVTDRALAIFERLARAEAKVHGTTIDEVHFHEVGGYDCITDIVGTVVGLELLGVQRLFASPVNLGSGTVTFSHGTFPVPAPAVAELLKGAPVYQPATITGELTTPTGAAILHELVSEYGPLPMMQVFAVGYGAGDRIVPGYGSLRFLLGQPADRKATRREWERLPYRDNRVIVIETNVDDMNPELLGYCMERLLAQGALDVYFTPIQMKKNRPGTLLSVIAPPEQLEELTRIVLTETSSLGVRYAEMQRICLDRETRNVRTRYGLIRMKLGLLAGKKVTKAPEYESCRTAALKHGVPLKRVYAAALRASSSKRGNHR